MRKQYNTPICEAIEFSSLHIIATSDPSLKPGSSDTSKYNLSKDLSFDFSEEDDEEYL